jgi:hypothetical protein
MRHKKKLSWPCQTSAFANRRKRSLWESIMISSTDQRRGPILERLYLMKMQEGIRYYDCHSKTREYVLGFQQRRDLRKKKAQEDLKEIEKKAKREARKMVRPI